ncbi:hypothetical protein NQ317_017117 [Molorchus minor]|uniref:Uncharacterized protein n=1 Tax=Molorchus minor TaxID=1323400 RepID=A0ABQ9JIQ7_9CUCU|nr:hypothetical protein NQ317_017117 [Molorchus minor]
MQMENRKFEDIMDQLNEYKKRYGNLKSELDKERIRSEKLKMTAELKINDLENENEKQKSKNPRSSRKA